MRANGGRLPTARKLSGLEIERLKYARAYARMHRADKAANAQMYAWYQSLIEIHITLCGPKAYNLSTLSNVYFLAG